MSNVLTKLVQNWTEYSIPTEIYIISESMLSKGTTKTKWVDPYNADYYYTDFTISASSWVKWEEWKQYLINWDSMTVASSYRNVRFRIWTGSYIPLMSSWWVILAWSTYCKKAYTRPYYYSTKYQSGGALHLLEDDNSTYSSMSAAEWQTGTATTARSITATNLKSIINYHAPEDMIVTQTDYDNLPSDKNSDNRTYFICETIS